MTTTPSSQPTSATTAAPAGTRPESLPSTWTGADEAFFAIAAHLFTPGFLLWAGVLLASYDEDDVAEAPAAAPVVAAVPVRATAPVRSTR
jgi:hypothetical protein